MKKILVLFAHPAFQKSRVNKILVRDIDQLENITFHDLYQAYPEMDIDIKYEQQLLEQHDIIIFHHPFFWYSTPAILKEWQDLVLTHGWAYGSHGNALEDKWFFNTISTGGKREAYCTKGYNRFTIRQLLAPIERSVHLCKMNFLPPFVIYGSHAITTDEIHQHAGLYHQILQSLRDDSLDYGKIEKLENFNDYFK